MKNFALIFLTLLIVSCTKSEPFVCDDDALFSREAATGSMHFISCYESWSIHMDETTVDDGRMNAASLDIPSEFHIEGMRVKFDACFYQFDLPSIIPDPTPIGELYVIKDFSISQE